MFFIGNNCASIHNKKESLFHIIDKYNPGVLTLQETKVRRNGTRKVENYTVFESIRNESLGGGLMTIIHDSLSPICVSVDDESEILVVEANIESHRVRIINAYGKQESDNEHTRKLFFNQLDTEIKSALVAGCLICLQLDANSKVG